MEWNKIEQEIQSASQKKELKPSANAWERLNNKLDAQEKPVKKKSKRIFLRVLPWVACLVLGVWFFNYEPNKEIESKLPMGPIISSDNPQVKTVEEQKDKEQEETIINKEEIILPKASKNNAIVSTTKNRKNTQSEILKLEPKGVITYGMDQKIRENKLLEESKIVIIDNAKIEEIRREDIKGIHIASKHLLREVEKELETEYRISSIEVIIKETKKLIVNYSNINYEKSN